MISFSIAHVVGELLGSAALRRALHALRAAFAATPAAIAYSSLCAGSPDERLRRRLLDRLRHDPAWQADASNVLVDQGRVTLQGVFARRADRAHTAAVVRRSPGVQRVTDARVRAGDWQSLG